jgi:hypothetical protein
MKSANSLVDLNQRIGEIECEIGALENSGPPLAERLVNAEAELGRCREHFERFGFGVVGVLPAQRQQNFRHSVVGALMAIDGNALLLAERGRIERDHQARGGSALNAEEKAERLDELRRGWRRLAAERERLWRSAEASGQPVDRAAFDPEMFLLEDRDLARIAAGQTAEETVA